MTKYKYTGQTNPFVNNGEILEGHLTTWSVKKPNSNEREEIKLFYKKGAGFKGEDIPISSLNLYEVKP